MVTATSRPAVGSVRSGEAAGRGDRATTDLCSAESVPIVMSVPQKSLSIEPTMPTMLRWAYFCWSSVEICAVSDGGSGQVYTAHGRSVTRRHESFTFTTDRLHLQSTDRRNAFRNGTPVEYSIPYSCPVEFDTGKGRRTCGEIGDINAYYNPG